MNPGEFILLLILVPFVVSILANELTNWFPRMAEKVLEYWVRKLPKQARQRWIDEWLGELDRIPGGVSKLWFAIWQGVGIGMLKREELRNAIRVLNDEKVVQEKLIPVTITFGSLRKVTLEDLSLTQKTLDILKDEGVDSLKALIALSERDLENIPGLGTRSIDEINNRLAIFRPNI